MDKISPSQLALYLLMWVVAPAVLFGFFILFGSDSYQFWGERYHLNLTNKYLFSHLTDGSLLGPLWREDILSGSLWMASLVTSPYAVHTLSARLFQLSPFGIDILEFFVLYVVGATSMYAYLRSALFLSYEGAVAGAVTFATTAYWLSVGSGVQDMPMGAAWVPSFLAMAHSIDRTLEVAILFRSLMLRIAGLVLLFYAYALNSSPSTLVTVCILLLFYVTFVFASVRSVLAILLAVGLGLILYSPFFWSVAEATRFSQRYLGDYFAPVVFNSYPSFLVQVKDILPRIAVGHNQYGLYPVVVLVVAIWAVQGPRLKIEGPRVQKIIRFAGITTCAFFLFEIFSNEINRAKQDIPFIGGWTAERFQIFTFFPLLTLFAWMLDRTLLRAPGAGLSEKRLTGARWAVFLTGMLAWLQVTASAFRMKQVPASIYPQNYVMYAYLFLYAFVTLTLFVLVYMQTCRSLRGEITRSRAVWYVGLLVISVSLTTAVHGYRSGVLPARGGPHPDVIMTYAQRYAIPADLAVIKRMNTSDSRIVDLTREMPNIPWTADIESAALPLSGLRTSSGYNLFHPIWYGRLIEAGVNGGTGRPFLSVVQVRASEKTNFEVLGLLDVQYVLAYPESHLSGYLPVHQLEGIGKTLFAAEGDVGPAFVSSNVRCFMNDAEALRYIHHSTLRDLKTEAVLVSSDDEAAALCGGIQGVASVQVTGKTNIQVLRGSDQVSVKVENSTGGILTLGDSYYPGWKVYVDGLEKPLLRTYTALRGVEIGTGHQSVEYRYEPKMFWMLFQMSNILLGLLLLIALVAWVWHRGRSFGMQLARGGRQSE